MPPLNFLKVYEGSDRGGYHDHDRKSFQRSKSAGRYVKSAGTSVQLPHRTRNLWVNAQQQVMSSVPAIVEDNPDNLFEGSSSELEGSQYSLDSRSQSSVPSVHRENSISRLREFFDDHEGGPLLQELARGNDCYSSSSRSEGEAGPSSVLRSPTIDSQNLSDRTGSVPSSECQSSLGSATYPPEYDVHSHRHTTTSPSLLLDQDFLPHHFYRTVTAPNEIGDDRRYHSMDDGYNDGKTYCYIIPGGVNVIFKDEDGNEIMRVGGFGPRSHRSRHPILVQDEDGNELYRSDDFISTRHGTSSFASDCRPRYNGSYERGYYRHHRSYPRSPYIVNSDQRFGDVASRMDPFRGYSSSQFHSARASTTPSNIILIDDHGQQLPICIPHHTSRRARSQPFY